MNLSTMNSVHSLEHFINHTKQSISFITSNPLTTKCNPFPHKPNVHIKLINGEELITLWQQFYIKLSDDDKNRLPLQPIYFLGVNES